MTTRVLLLATALLLLGATPEPPEPGTEFEPEAGQAGDDDTAGDDDSDGDDDSEGDDDDDDDDDEGDDDDDEGDDDDDSASPDSGVTCESRGSGGTFGFLPAAILLRRRRSPGSTAPRAAAPSTHAAISGRRRR